MALRRAAAPLWALMPRAAASFDVVAVASSAAAARLFTTHPSTPIGGRASTRREHTPISVPRSETGQFDTKNLQFLMLVDLATLGFCKVEVHVDNTADLIKAAGWLSNKYEFAGQHLLMRPYVRSENVSTLACSFNAALISDWLCSVCASLNPSTHTQCWKCGQVQQESPQRVSHDSRGGGASSSGGTSGSRHNRSGTDGGRTSVHTRARQISHDIMQQQQRQQRQQGQQQALAPPPAAHAMVCSSTRPSDLATFVVNRLVSAPPGTNVVLSAAGPTSLRNLVGALVLAIAHLRGLGRDGYALVRQRRPPSRRASDWLCGACASVNPGDSTECAKCGDVKPEDGEEALIAAAATAAAASADPHPHQPIVGEWLCSACSAFNFWDRTECHKCSAVHLGKTLALGAAAACAKPRKPRGDLRAVWDVTLTVAELSGRSLDRRGEGHPRSKGPHAQLAAPADEEGAPWRARTDEGAQWRARQGSSLEGTGSCAAAHEAPSDEAGGRHGSHGMGGAAEGVTSSGKRTWWRAQQGSHRGTRGSAAAHEAPSEAGKQGEAATRARVPQRHRGSAWVEGDETGRAEGGAG